MFDFLYSNEKVNLNLLVHNLLDNLFLKVHKSDINTGKDRCGVAKHFLNDCTGINKLENVEVQLIEVVKEGNYDLGGKLWSREKYCQAQLFTLTHGMSSTWDWFSSNRKGYRKKK